MVTVPAYFNDAQRQATKDAGTIAGLEVWTQHTVQSSHTLNHALVYVYTLLRSLLAQYRGTNCTPTVVRICGLKLPHTCFESSLPMTIPLKSHDGRTRLRGCNTVWNLASKRTVVIVVSYIRRGGLFFKDVRKLFGRWLFPRITVCATSFGQFLLATVCVTADPAFTFMLRGRSGTHGVK